MGLILARSPFNISRQNFDPNVNMIVQVGRFKDGIFSVKETYNINFRNSLYVDISNLIRDRLDSEINYSTSLGRYTWAQSYQVIVRTQIQARTGGSTVPDIIDYYVATDGYLYNTDTMNQDYSSYLRDNAFYAGSSDVIYKLDDSNIRIPLINSSLDVTASQVTETATITTYKNGDAKQTITHEFDSEFSSTFYNLIEDFSSESYLNRVNEDGGVYEESKCLDKFIRNQELNDIDKIIISTDDAVKVIQVKSIVEPKYKPYRLTFRNRFGLSEDLWFFKKSVDSLSVKSDEFRSNQIGARSAGELVRSSQEYNKNGVEMLTLNSGFVDEALNESFKQLMLSEQVTLYDFKEDVEKAVKIKDSELKLKTSTNDKLINYTIELEVSSNIIDNIV